MRTSKITRTFTLFFKYYFLGFEARDALPPNNSGKFPPRFVFGWFPHQNPKKKI